MRAAPLKLVAALAATLPAAGCGLVLDPDQARVCRTALPALEADGGAITITRTLPSDDGRGIRIDYLVTGRAGEGYPRFAVCRFAPALSAQDRANLDAITTDRGPVAGASLYLLKRFYLDTAEALAGAPGPGDRTVSLPELPRPLAVAAEQALVGLPRIAVYGLLASGYALLFGLVGRISLAFGALASVGAAAAGLVVAALSFGALVAAPGAVLAGIAAAIMAASLHGMVVGRLAFASVRRDRLQASLIATVGLALALSEYLRLAGGPVPNWIPPVWSDPVPIARAEGFVVTLTPAALAAAGVGAAAAAALVAGMRTTPFGRAWRASADDPVAAALCGIDGPRLLLATAALSGGLAGLAGALVAVQFGALGFADGFPLGLKALAAAVLGGVGSVEGALLGGLAIGVFETLWSAALPIEGRDLALHVVLIMAVILLPGGVLGRDRESQGTFGGRP